MQSRYQQTWAGEATERPAGVSAKNWSYFVRHVYQGESLGAIARSERNSSVKVGNTIHGIHRALNLVRLVQGTGLEVVPYRLLPYLLRAGLRHADDIRRASDHDLLRIGYIGPRTLKQIREVLPAGLDSSPYDGVLVDARL
jgi:hypothetical protein